MSNTEYMNQIPLQIDAGLWTTGHIQGIAVDTKHEYIYYSFTTVLVKAKLDGTVVGWVGGLIGHLGCIEFNDEDGRLYASLELKHDSIGQGIMKRAGVTIADEDSFYISIFDVDKIVRPDMDAEADGIMKAVYLPEVVDWYNAKLPDGKDHKYACSGIDGIAIGPVFGEDRNSRTMLMVACGIYGDVEREDNDCNVLLQFDWRELDDYAKPLTQREPHHSGTSADKIYFLFTGNTTWGIQNLEYDEFTGDWLISVYLGRKEKYPNFPMYVIDGSASPYEDYIAYGEKGLHLSLKKEGVCHKESGVYGNRFPVGQTGIYSFGNGYYYFSHNYRTPEKVQGSIIKLYRRCDNQEIPFEEVVR